MDAVKSESLDLIRETIKFHVDKGHEIYIVNTANGVMLQRHTADGMRESTLYNGDSRNEMLAFASEQRDIFMAEKHRRESVAIEFELPRAQALALAQMVKRITFDRVRENAVDDAETYRMLDAIYVLRKALEEAGFAPR